MKAFDDGYSIQAVSRRSGVHPVTLRAWERHYGLIRPARTERGHRRYSDQDLAVIERILSWLDRGLAISQVRPVLEQGGSPVTAVAGPWRDAMEDALQALEGHNLRRLEQLFQRLKLDANGREAARKAFNRGKAAGFDLDREVAEFAQLCRGQQPLLNLFLQLQLAAVAADGAVHPAEHRMLVRIARGLGLSETEVNRLEAMLRGERRGSSASDLADAYAVLGVSPQASDSDVRQAYRRLMSENHPDKLAAKGLPESMRPVAEEKTRTITAAYDRIKAARG